LAPFISHGMARKNASGKATAPKRMARTECPPETASEKSPMAPRMPM
jgi:hypothetical protein